MRSIWYYNQCCFIRFVACVSSDHTCEGGQQNGKVRFLWERRHLWDSGFSLPSSLQPHLEAQREARQGYRGGHSHSRICLLQMPPFRESYPCVMCEHPLMENGPLCSGPFSCLCGGYANRSFWVKALSPKSTASMFLIWKMSKTACSSASSFTGT